MEVTITNAAVLKHWGSVKSVVSINDERNAHIQNHHPEDYEYYSQFIADAIISPFLILEDHKNDRTVMFIGKTERERIRVVVKLARMQDLEDRSFVVTMHPVGERSIRKLRNHNTVIWEDQNHALQDEKSML